MIESLKDHNVVGAACGKNHTLILTGKCLGSGYITGMGSVIYEFHKTGLHFACPFYCLGLVCIQVFIYITLVVKVVNTSCPMLIVHVDDAVSGVF